MIRIGICGGMAWRNQLEVIIDNIGHTRKDISYKIYTWETIKSMSVRLRRLRVDIVFIENELCEKDMKSVIEFTQNMKGNGVPVVSISSDSREYCEFYGIQENKMECINLTDDEVKSILSENFVEFHDNSEYFVFSFRRKLYREKMNDIMYIGSCDKHLQLHMSDGRIRYFVGKLDDKLSAFPESYIRISKSFVINSFYIKSFSRSKIILSDGTAFSISRTYKTEAVARLEAAVTNFGN